MFEVAACEVATAATERARRDVDLCTFTYVDYFFCVFYIHGRETGKTVSTKASLAESRYRQSRPRTAILRRGEAEATAEAMT